MFCYNVTHDQDAPCNGSQHLCPIDIIRGGDYSEKNPVHVHTDKDGNRSIVRLYFSPVYENGELVEVIESAIDITNEVVAASKLARLDAILPICASCKNIRGEDGEWYGIESFINKNSGTDFSHSICPPCYKKLYSDVG